MMTEAELLNAEDGSASGPPSKAVYGCSKFAKLAIAASVFCSVVALGLVHARLTGGSGMMKVDSEPAIVELLSGWQQEVLDLHNDYRSAHAAPALTWNTALASKAQSCLSKNHGPPPNWVLKHCSSGENIAGVNQWYDHKAGVKMWYDEIAHTSGGDGAVTSFGMNTGHYTQVVWKSTTKIGCAKKSDIMICNYAPPGNMQGAFEQNVIPLSKADSSGSAPDGGSCKDKTLPNGDDWHDSDGQMYHCNWYKKATRCYDHGHSHAYKGMTAKDACCECGGGAR